MAKTRGTGRLWRLKALVTALVVAVVALVVTIVVQGNDSAAQQGGSHAQASRQPQATSQQDNPLESLAHREPGDPLARGRADAPVVMVAFEDFRCPFCAKFSTDTAPKLIERYVKKGVLRIEWRDYPIFGEQSVLAAKAGRAAARQGKFWAFHDVVYSHAPPTGHPDLPLPKLVEYAKQAGVPDIERFKSDIHDPAVEREVHADMSLATRLGVRSTPSFVINGKPVVGAQPTQVFVKIIEKARKQAR